MDELLPYPQQTAEEAARTAEMIARVQKFLDECVDPDKIDAEEKIPQSVIKGLGELGVMGMTVPREFGGGGSPVPSCVAVDSAPADSEPPRV